MNQQAYELCKFFIRFKEKMVNANRPNVADFAQRQLEKHEKQLFGGQAV